MSISRKNILTICDSLELPSYQIFIHNPLSSLAQIKKNKISLIESSVQSYKRRMLNNIDCVVFCRTTTQRSYQILKDVLKKKIPYIYDIDDNFFHLPADDDVGKYHRDPYAITNLLLFLQHASLVRVYSSQMLAELSEINSNVKLCNSYVDLNLLNNIDFSKTTALIPKKNKRVRVVYATSRKKDAQLALIIPALMIIADKYKGLVDIYVWGSDSHTLQELLQRENVFYLPPESSYKEFIAKFSAYAFDIGLAPLQEGLFFNSKNNTKYRDYSSFGVAGIYSNTPVYNTSVIDGEAGLLVNNTEADWVAAIEKLVNDQVLREKIKDKAKQDIEKNYTLDCFSKTLKQHIKETILSKSKLQDNMVEKAIQNTKRWGLFFGNEIDSTKYYSFFKKNMYITIIYLFKINEFNKLIACKKASLKSHFIFYFKIINLAKSPRASDSKTRLKNTQASKYISLFKKNYVAIIKNYISLLYNLFKSRKERRLEYQSQKERMIGPVYKLNNKQELTQFMHKNQKHLLSEPNILFLDISSGFDFKKELDAYKEYSKKSIFIIFHRDEHFKVPCLGEAIRFIYLPPGSEKVLSQIDS